jgi:undecaprenyl-diphosphatase
VDKLWQFDQTLFRDIHIGLHKSWLDPVFWVISSSGLGWVQTVILLLVIGITVYKSGWRMNDTVRLALASLFSFAFTGVVDTLIKHFVPRERPSNLVWAHPQEQIFSRSFASGHTASSFSIALILFFLTRNSDKRRVGWIALVWAALVGFSRMYRGVHWPSDVLSGFGVALACTSLLMFILPKEFAVAASEQEKREDGSAAEAVAEA